MAKNYITGTLTDPVTIDEAGIWIMTGSSTIIIPGDINNLHSGIQTLQGAGAIDLIVRGDITMGGALDSGVMIESNDAQVTIGATSKISATDGVKSANSVAEVSIVNTGIIDSSHAGMFMDASVSHITNEAGGQITGGFAGIMSGPGNAGDSLTIVNWGEIACSGGGVFAISIDDANANIVNRGTITGDVKLGTGDDRFNTRFGELNGKIIGGTGDDVFILKSDQQAAKIIELDSEGTDTMKVGSDPDAYLYDFVENLTLLGSGDFKGNGNILDNVIIGNRGANALAGLAGDDTLAGGRGNDTLEGGLDADQFVFARNSDVDTISDFNQLENDHIQIKGWTNINEYSDLSGKIRQVGTSVVINFGDGDRLIINDITKAELTADDFIF